MKMKIKTSHIMFTGLVVAVALAIMLGAGRWG